MKILTFAAGIALALGSIASSVPSAEAQRPGYGENHNRPGYDRRDDRRRYDRNDRRWKNNHRRCWTERRHHRNVRVCR